MLAVQAADIVLLGVLFYVSVRRIGDWSTIAWALSYGLVLSTALPGDDARHARFIVAFAVELLAVTGLAVAYTLKHHGPNAKS